MDVLLLCMLWKNLRPVLMYAPVNLNQGRWCIFEQCLTLIDWFSIITILSPLALAVVIGDGALWHSNFLRFSNWAISIMMPVSVGWCARCSWPWHTILFFNDGKTSCGRRRRGHFHPVAYFAPSDFPFHCIVTLSAVENCEESYLALFYT